MAGRYWAAWGYSGLLLGHSYGNLTNFTPPCGVWGKHCGMILLIMIDYWPLLYFILHSWMELYCVFSLLTLHMSWKGSFPGLVFLGHWIKTLFPAFYSNSSQFHCIIHSWIRKSVTLMTPLGLGMPNPLACSFLQSGIDSVRFSANPESNEKCQPIFVYNPGTRGKEWRKQRLHLWSSRISPRNNLRFILIRG